MAGGGWTHSYIDMKRQVVRLLVVTIGGGVTSNARFKH